MRKLAVFLSTLLTMALASSLALAADAQVTVAALDTVSTIALAAGLGIAIGVSGPAIGQGLTVFATVTGIARNPEVAGTLRVNMIIGLALIESLAIYALVVALLLFYAFPFSPAVSALLG
ncbi:MAG: ATP synthase F0 subunit C [Deltaproteobacteria bacterium]|jgi:F-type H+-transporting ATPase subunit c|nr:ATP synthase F0 subunit C [Deltaproteobacteria bacterium]